MKDLGRGGAWDGSRHSGGVLLRLSLPRGSSSAVRGRRSWSAAVDSKARAAEPLGRCAWRQCLRAT